MASKRARTEVDGQLSAAEATQYDRQIRLWGVGAQQRIRSTAVCMIGATGMAAEACKNLVLAGIKSLTVLDDASVAENTLGGNFFTLLADIGSKAAEVMVPKLRLLNKNVDITADTEPVSGKSADYFKQFDIVCTTGLSLAEMERLDELCASVGTRFFGGAVYGFFGFFFANLHEHDYTAETREKQKDSEEEIVKTTAGHVSFVTLKQSLAHTWEGCNQRRWPSLYFALRGVQNLSKEPTDEEVVAAQQAVMKQLCVPEAALPVELLRTLARNKGHCELSATCAVLGGLLAGEVIKAVSNKDKPLTNWFLFDGTESVGSVEHIGAPAQPPAPAAAAAEALVID